MTTHKHRQHMSRRYCQREALRLLRAGYSHPEIAARLGVHVRTAEIYTSAARERAQQPRWLADVRR